LINNLDSIFLFRFGKLELVFAYPVPVLCVISQNLSTKF